MDIKLSENLGKLVRVNTAQREDQIPQRFTLEGFVGRLQFDEEAQDFMVVDDNPANHFGAVSIHFRESIAHAYFQPSGVLEIDLTL